MRQAAPHRQKEVRRHEDEMDDEFEVVTSEKPIKRQMNEAPRARQPGAARTEEEGAKKYQQHKTTTEKQQRWPEEPG